MWAIRCELSPALAEQVGELDVAKADAVPMASYHVLMEQVGQLS